MDRFSTKKTQKNKRNEKATVNAGEEERITTRHAKNTKLQKQDLLLPNQILKISQSLSYVPVPLIRVSILPSLTAEKGSKEVYHTASY